MYDLKKYREARALLPHLDTILKILALTEKALSYYICYIQVAKILFVIKQEKEILETYKNLLKKNQETKGKINN